MSRPIPLLDAVFLLIDRPATPANVGVVLLLEPPPGQSAAHAVQAAFRKYRAARPQPPFDCVPDLPGLALPQWRTAGRIDPRRHVHRHRLDAPGTHQQLMDLVAGLHREPLDRRRPLFEVHFVEGLDDDRYALYLKSHHATWDGQSAMARVFAALTPEPGRLQPPFFAQDFPATAAPEGGAFAAGLRGLLQQGAALRELVTRLNARVQQAREPGARPAANQPFAGPQTRFNGAVGPERSVAGFSLTLDDMRQVARAFGGTLNDVVITVVDAGVHRYLAACNELPAEPLVAMCPVSHRQPGDQEATTKAATLFVRLGEPRAGVGRRMSTIVASTAAAKQELGELSHEAAVDYAVLAFGLSLASQWLGLGAVARPVVNLVISNVGGVAGPRYLGRSRLVGAYPVSMVAEPTGLNVTTLSSDGRMDFGILADAALLPDPQELARHCRAAFARLRRAAVQRPAGPTA